MTVHKLPILALDMKFLKTEYGVPIEGLIGYNFLKYFAVTLDYKKNQVVLSYWRRHIYYPFPAPNGIIKIKGAIFQSPDFLKSGDYFYTKKEPPY
ncbi:hypothetical protein SRRS_14670 [Sporomusa rhizae]